jgi:hypothetical protein
VLGQLLEIERGCLSAQDDAVLADFDMKAMHPPTGAIQDVTFQVFAMWRRERRRFQPRHNDQLLLTLDDWENARASGVPASLLSILGYNTG